MINAFIYGVLLAFGLIIPLGPQNMFILNLGSKSQRLTQALPAVVTASLCDTLLILLATFGVSLFILDHYYIKIGILTIGIIFLLYLSYNMWVNASHDSANKTAELWSIKKQILFCLSVSILNPHAILDTVAVIGSNALLFKNKELIAFTSACIFLSWLWFFNLALFGKWLSRFQKFRFYLDRIAAVIIALCCLNLVRFLI